MVKERWKDDSLDIADAGAKMKALINEHLIDLGINPKIPPIELLSPDSLANVQKHAHGDPEALASEMEHAIRKHCTVHFDEDPAFYKKLRENLARLIDQHKINWAVQSEGYERRRHRAEVGRTDAMEGLTKESTAFYEYVAQLAFASSEVPPELVPRVKSLSLRIERIFQKTTRHYRFLGKAH